jgi:membrane-associated phospholipid phosphatase
MSYAPLHLRVFGTVLLALVGAAAPARAQQRDVSAAPREYDAATTAPTSPMVAPSPSGARRWLVAGALLITTAALDVRLRDYAASHQRPALDRVANVVDPLGRAGVLVPSLAIGVIAPRVLHRRALSDQVLRVAADYVASDVVESVLKPMIGRHRPSDGGGALRFRPFQNDADWHSLPSAHTVHAFSIATGIANEAGPRWAGDAAYGVAGLVGLERVYTGAHWSSDVVASTLLATAVSSATHQWLARRMHRGE